MNVMFPPLVVIAIVAEVVFPSRAFKAFHTSVIGLINEQPTVGAKRPPTLNYVVQGQHILKIQNALIINVQPLEELLTSQTRMPFFFHEPAEFLECYFPVAIPIHRVVELFRQRSNAFRTISIVRQGSIP